MSMSVNNRIGGMMPSQTTQPYRAGNGLPDGGNNLYRGSSIIPESASVDADTITVTPENIGRLGGDVLLTPQQMKELYEKGSLQVRREFQTAESNEGFMTLTAKLAAALVGPSRSIAAIQIDPLFLEMIKDPNAKVGMGYTTVNKETWTVMPSPEQRSQEPPIMPPEPAPPYDVPETPDYITETPEPEPEPEPEGEIYRIARTATQAEHNKIVQEYRDQGFPALGNGESVGDSTYDGATAEAILGRKMQVPFQYTMRASLNFNSLNSGDSTQAASRRWVSQMADVVGFGYHVDSKGNAYLTDTEGKRVPPDGRAFKDAVANKVGLGNFTNAQNLQDHVKFVQAVGYTDPLNATELSGQVADRTPEKVQGDLGRMFSGHSLDNTRHEYFTANDLANQPVLGEDGQPTGETRLDIYREATQNTPIPDADLASYTNHYNSVNGTSLSVDEMKAKNPTYMDAYALHAQKFQPSLGITFSDGKANVPEGSVNSVLNARIVLESNTGGGDELLYDTAAVNTINQRVEQVFGGGDGDDSNDNTGMQLRVTNGAGEEVTIAQDDVVEFLQFLNNGEGVKQSAGNVTIDQNSVFNDVEAQITNRYNNASGTNLNTVGNGFVRRPGVGTTPQPAPNTDTTVQNPSSDTTTGETPIAGNAGTNVDTTNTGTVTTTQGASRTDNNATGARYTSQSVYDAVNIDLATATSGRRFAPGTSTQIETRAKANIAELRSRLDGGEDITIQNMEGESVPLTQEMLTELETKVDEAVTAMAVLENKEIGDNPQNFETETNDDGTVTNRPLSGAKMADRDLGALNEYMRGALADRSIQPGEQREIAERVDTIAKNLFTDLKNRGIASGNYTPAALNEITPEMVRGAEGVSPQEANEILGAIEAVKFTTSQVSMTPDLNHAMDLTSRIENLSERLDSFYEVEVAKQAFTGELSAIANLDDPTIFDNFISEAYNLEPLDENASPEVRANYETLRTHAQNGTLPFPATIQVVDPSELNGADGAYVNADGSPESGQIKISSAIINNPERLRDVMAEEMFHHLERIDEVQGSMAGGGTEDIAGDEGRGALRALRELQRTPNASRAQIADAVNQGRGEASTVRTGGKIAMEDAGSDRGTYRMAGGRQGTIEFSTQATGDVENTTSADTETENTTPGVDQYAAVDMEVTPRNPHPTRDVDMRGVDAELFNAAPPIQMDEDAAARLNEHPETEDDKKFSMGDVVKGLPDLALGTAKTLEAYAERLQELVQKHFFGQNGVANNLGNASDLMGQAQSLNGYHNTNPDLKLTKLSANYSTRPVYDNQNAKSINDNSEQYHKQQLDQIVDRNTEREARMAGHGRVVG